jgi:hypothetical protein
MDSYGALMIIPNMVPFAVTAWVAFKVYAGKSTEHRLAISICFAFIAIKSPLIHWCCWARSWHRISVSPFRWYWSNMSASR